MYNVLSIWLLIVCFRVIELEQASCTQIIRKIVKIIFLDTWDQNKILKVLIFSKFVYMASISYINRYFRAPSPLKPLKSRPQGQNLPGFTLIAHSGHRGPVSAKCCRLNCLYLTLFDFIGPYVSLS